MFGVRSFRCLSVSGRVVVRGRLVRRLGPCNLALKRPGILSCLGSRSNTGRGRVTTTYRVRTNSLASILGHVRSRGVIRHQVLGKGHESFRIFLAGGKHELRRVIRRGFRRVRTITLTKVSRRSLGFFLGAFRGMRGGLSSRGSDSGWCGLSGLWSRLLVRGAS